MDIPFPICKMGIIIPVSIPPPPPALAPRVLFPGVWRAGAKQKEEARSPRIMGNESKFGLGWPSGKWARRSSQVASGPSTLAG